MPVISSDVIDADACEIAQPWPEKRRSSILSRTSLSSGAMAATVATVLAAASTAHATAGPTEIGRELRPTSAAAYGGTVAWSRYDPMHRRYRLVLWSAARGARLAAVPSRTVPFDVDLGPARDGATLAVYSRCRVEAETLPFELPRWTDGRGCRLYRLDVASGREHRVRSGLPARWSTVLPSVWRDRIAYAARDDARPGRWRAFTRRGTRIARRLPTGLRDLRGPGRRPRPTGLDLYGRYAAVAWEGEQRADECRPTSPVRDDRVSEVRLARVGVDVRDRSLDRGCDTRPLTEVRSPSFAAGRVLYTVSPNSGEDRGPFVRSRNLSGSDVQDRSVGLAPETGPLLSLAAADASIVTVVGTPTAVIAISPR